MNWRLHHFLRQASLEVGSQIIKMRQSITISVSKCSVDCDVLLFVYRSGRGVVTTIGFIGFFIIGDGGRSFHYFTIGFSFVRNMFSR